MAQNILADPSDLGLWPAGAVARRLGISASTLRSWNHRYGIGPPDHRPGRHRLYSERDITDLEAIQRLVANGTTPRAAVSLVRTSREPEGRAPSEAARPVIRSARGIESAAIRLDAGALTDAFDESLRTSGALYTWHKLARPALARLGRRIVAQRDCMDAEAVLTWSMLACLHRTPHDVPGRAAPVALLACVQGEQHSLVLETLHAALAERSVATCMLGPSVADAALLDAAERIRPTVVVLAAQQFRTARRKPLHKLARVTPQVIAAGPGWPDGETPPNILRIDRLDRLVETVTTILRSE